MNLSLCANSSTDTNKIPKTQKCNKKKKKKKEKLFVIRQGSPVDCRPSTTEAPPIGKIHPNSKIAITFEAVMQILCPLRFRIFLKIVSFMLFKCSLKLRMS